MRVKSEFIAGAANTVSEGAVWLEMEEEKSILFYGVSNVIAIADVHTQNVLCTLPGHTDRVTTITKLNDYSTRSVSDMSTPISIVTSGADGTIMVWEHVIGSPVTAWSVVATLKIPGSRGSITTHTSLSTTLGTLICASDSQGTVVTFFKSMSATGAVSGPEGAGGFEELEIQHMQPMHMPNDLTLMYLPSAMDESDTTIKSRHHSVMLVIGSVDSKVHLRVHCVEAAQNGYTYSHRSTLVGMLTGHDDWIRCLSGASYVTDPVSKITSLYFASGSQDSKIRVWCITPTSVAAVEESPTTDLSVQEDDDEDESNEISEALDSNGGESGATQDGLSEEGLGEARCAFRCATWWDKSSSPGVYCESESRYLVTLDALLVGHEDWVSSLHWIRSGHEMHHEDPSVADLSRSTQSFYLPNSGEGNQLKLFSTSMDRNMVIWCPDEDSGIWLPTTRMGDIGGNLGGSVGGNLLGFVGSCIDLRSHSVLGIGYGGSFHLWQWRKDASMAKQSIDIDSIQLTEKEDDVAAAGAAFAVLTTSDDSYAWRPVSFLTGHFAAVRDVVWGYGGSFLISVSADQTCRLFSPLVSGSRKWCELSRPQIHGYDLSCVQLAPHETAPFTIYSGGDEKAVRIFEAPTVVTEGLVKLSNNEWADEYCSSAAPDNTDSDRSVLKGGKVHRAYIPELGLSNKSSNMMNEEEVKEQASRGVDTSLWLSGAPLEGQLSDFTIWPEVKKLFGHVGDVVCLSASPCGRWIASAGKGRDASSASIRIWETRRRVCVAVLAGHESTVTALRFSPDSRYIISGGKDRSLYLYKINMEYDDAADTSSASPFIPCAYLGKAHKRIIWDVAWITVDGIDVFSSVSRDGSVKIWKIGPDADNRNMCKLVPLASFNPFKDIAVTAVDVTPCDEVTLSSGAVQSSGFLLAFGAESGAIEVWFLSGEDLSSNGDNICTRVEAVPAEYCHGSAVRRLQWKSNCRSSKLNDSSSDSDAPTKIQLASCGDDHCVRVFSILP